MEFCNHVNAVTVTIVYKITTLIMFNSINLLQVLLRTFLLQKILQQEDPTLQPCLNASPHALPMYTSCIFYTII